MDFIEWLCSYSKSFKVIEMGNDIIGYTRSIDIAETVSIGYGAIQGQGDKSSYDHWKNIYYPLLLSEAIDGINCNTDWVITSYWDRIAIEQDTGDGLSYELHNVVSARQSALTYIYHKEKKSA
ncbi:MAG: hypothetical protein PQJ59_16885 [Spirochaetales bacterium]|nr:hypothetical protein [Spirochaetales bacterium]